MRVATYNLWDGGLNESGDRRARLRDVVREIGADIVALIEARGFEKTLPEWERAFGVEGAMVTSPSGFHIALLVRPPLRLRSVGSLHEGMFYHSCLSARIQAPSEEIHVLAAHLNPFDPASRLTEARHLAREARDDRPVLLLGDFNGLSPRDGLDESVFSLSNRVLARHVTVDSNSLPERPPLDTRAIALLEWAGFVDVFRRHNPTDAGWSVPTHAGQKHGTARMRLDYIFATPSLADRARECRVVRSPNADVASDHYPVVADFVP